MSRVITLDTLDTPTCTPLRRQSYSSPASLLLEGCQARVQALSDRVTQTTVLSRKLRESDCWVRHSLSDLRQETLVTMSGRTCHHCHAPQSDPCHVGIPTGVGHCTLEHWENCRLEQPDGYDKHKKLWTGCPGVETAEESDEAGDKVDKDEIDDEVRIKGPEIPKSVVETDAGKKNSTDDESSEDTEDEEDRLARQEVEALKKRVELQEKQIETDSKLAMEIAKKEKKKAARLRIEQQKTELLLQEKNQLKKRSELSSRLSKSDPRSTSSKAGADLASLQSKAAELAARQQKAAADKSKLGSAGSISIAGIRQIPGMTQQVEEYLTSIQSGVPSLACDPTAAVYSGVQFQPNGVLTSGGIPAQSASGGMSVEPGYVYVAELGKLVPVLSSLSLGMGQSAAARQPVIPEQIFSASEVSEDEDCPVSPAPGYRLVWKLDSQGVKYCKEVKIRDRSPEIVTTWVKRSDGRIYKEQVTAESARRPSRVTSTRGGATPQTPQTTPRCSKGPVYVDYRQPTKQVRVAEVRKDERLPTFIASEERSGKDTLVPNLVKRARLCPVAWTDKITTEQLNPIIWSWAYIADLLAARSGQAPDLETGELEARLQHFLNVMEITLQSSSKTDYMGDSWKVGRLYHNKVQAKLDQGTTTWCRLVERWENATLPHELMAAQQELAPRQTHKTRESGQRDGETRVPRCGSWNTWETKGKCQWEAENPGEKCNRLHECTYCKTKKFRPVNHQRLYCPKRIAAGTD